AAGICDYLKQLGISHVYCSPYLQATKGSTHGYDVVNHDQVNQELGGEDGLRRFAATLTDQGLGQVLDIVPNHMAIGTRANTLWWDVLENGAASEYADFFDVDWNPPESKLRDTVLLPVLGDHYGRVLEQGQIRLAREGGKFVIRWDDHSWPAAPESIVPVLWEAAERSGSDELAFLADSAARLPRPTWTDAPNRQKRHRDKEVIARQLAALCERHSKIEQAVEQAIERVNADYDRLDGIVGNQNYRLAYWRSAQRDLGYRRFFDINTLIGLHMESERVFRETHRRILEWLRSGQLDGVRVDHPDGLRDPQIYFDRLRTAAPDAWIVAEKILEPGEKLRRTWPIAGTTGYDFLYRAGSVFVDPGGEAPLTDFYKEFTGETADEHEVVRSRKRQLLSGSLGSDVNRLTAEFLEVCEGHRCYRDYTRHEIHHALREVIASFPVYRTYVEAQVGRKTPDDERYVQEAIAESKKHRPDLPADLFDFIGQVLLLKVRGDRESEFVMRFQQFSGPAMAKGVEDTTFYVYNRLVSLNEVGCDPGVFGMPIQKFHELSAESFHHWPQAMLATSTHDTKRSEDVRARINLLSEIPAQWTDAVRRWAAHNERHKRDGWPDRNMEYLFYQTLFGAWPVSKDRMSNYMEKSSREAKTHTSWTEKNAKYDEALQAFIGAAYADEEFLHDIEAFTAPLIWPGRVNALAQALLRMTAPGIPDQYQGSEIWDLSLVDPDNRRPVDYDVRRKLLCEMQKL
ncbi:MAG: malto-oligosyltrehalose synthase, partial [Acidobacteriaceae bacterium]|nr:malto-oligosyltrehalose synthase [Acidobacteriaceae bacterium]